MLLRIMLKNIFIKNNYKILILFLCSLWGYIYLYDLKIIIEKNR